MSKIVDAKSGITTEYEYDSLDRLVYALAYKTGTQTAVIGTNNRYDPYGRPMGSTYALPDIDIGYDVEYKENSNLIYAFKQHDSVNNGINGKFYTYDALERVSSVITMINGLRVYSESYTYVTNGGNTSSLVATHTVDGVVYSYTYDGLGNITSVKENGTLKTAYIYDSLGQLIKATHYSDGQTVSYDYYYDKSGNITNVQYDSNWTIQSMSYTYGNSSWGDLLTNYNGTAITYDAIGNPTNWRNASILSWQGRNLVLLQHPDGTHTGYLYNADGIRTQKLSINEETTVAEVAAKYTLDGNKIVAEQRGDITLYYLYDDTDSIMGISYGDNTYTFAKNIQGDVIGIYSGGGLVAKYEYNAYGQILSITNESGANISNNATHIANLNPFRYRGYYYDTETGFYYLQSRYYDPVVGRFINEDGILNMGFTNTNLFAYCCNNPIRHVDPCGTCPHDGKVYQYGNFGGLPQYNPNCGKCAVHGSYTLIGKDGKSYGFRDTTRPFSEVPSQEDITLRIEGEIVKNILLAMNSVPLNFHSFYDYVSAGGLMDYKDPYRWAQAFPDIPYPGENKDYVVFGINISASDLGNLNYGIVGKEFGFPEEILLWQAGAAQLRDHKNYSFIKSEVYSLLKEYYGDQSDDYYMIKKGFNLY